MSDPSSIYTQAVMQRFKALHHQGPLEGATNTLRRVNPLCGDTVTVHLGAEESRWRVSFEGYGCALCMVSADLMAQAISGETEQCVCDILARHAGNEAPDELSAHLLTLDARRDCVMLPWQILAEMVRSIGA